MKISLTSLENHCLSLPFNGGLSGVETYGSATKVLDTTCNTNGLHYSGGEKIQS
jgi:hypothetical protein